MTWKGVLGTTLAATVLSFVLGLTVGMRGCQDASVTKLLEENARLKVKVQTHEERAQAIAKQRDAESQRRLAIERELEAARAREQAASESVKGLRRIVEQRTAKAQCKPERELIAALDRDRARKTERIGLLQQALEGAKLEIELGHSAEGELNKALMASEDRADALEKHVGKSRRAKILIGIGSALGGVALTLGATAAAGRLQ